MTAWKSRTAPLAATPSEVKSLAAKPGSSVRTVPGAGVADNARRPYADSVVQPHPSDDGGPAQELAWRRVWDWLRASPPKEGSP